MQVVKGSSDSKVSEPAADKVENDADEAVVDVDACEPHNLPVKVAHTSRFVINYVN